MEQLNEGIEAREDGGQLCTAPLVADLPDARFRELLDLVPIMAWSSFPDGSCEFLNKAHFKYTGMPASESRGSGWQQAIHPQDLPRRLATWRTSLESGEASESEARIKRHDGVYRWFLLRIEPFRNERGVIVRWYGSGTDIEDRKRAEERWAASEKRLSLIVNTIPMLIWSCLPDGHADFFNEPWHRYTALTSSQSDGWGWMSAVHPDDHRHATRHWRTVISTEDHDNGAFELRFRRCDGEYRWFWFRANAMRDELGALKRWYVTCIDIHDRKLASEALAQAQIELTQANRASSLGVLTASIAHEVNQPLAGIVTNAGTCLRMLSSDPPNVAGAIETARRTIRDGKRAADVISRLRTLFSHKDINATWWDLSSATREVVELAQSEIRANRILLTEAYDPDLPAILGDRIQIQQVIVNLIRNAIDAINIANGDSRSIHVSVGCTNESVDLRVEDSGTGFEQAVSGKLFDAFFTTKEAGMGIGLSVSRTIIEAHGGKLWAANNESGGATFGFSFPCLLRPGDRSGANRGDRPHPS